MAVVAVTKDERIDLRTTMPDKHLLEQAAEIRHLSLSSYIITVSLKQAQLDISEQETLSLAKADRELVLEALANPPEPNGALRSLFR